MGMDVWLNCEIGPGLRARALDHRKNGTSTQERRIKSASIIEIDQREAFAPQELVRVKNQDWSEVLDLGASRFRKHYNGPYTIRERSNTNFSINEGAQGKSTNGGDLSSRTGWG